MYLVADRLTRNESTIRRELVNSIFMNISCFSELSKSEYLNQSNVELKF